MVESPNDKLRIDIVSDVVCPWCIIGYSQLAQALADTGTQAHILWHPFELNPDMAPEGQNMREHLAEKYGSTPEQSAANRTQLRNLGQSLGFSFNFTDDTRMVNTFRAHQLIEWAQEQDKQTEMKLALFAAHFTDGRNVSDTATLAAIAGEIGLDSAAALAVLEEERFASHVRSMQKFWIDKGVRGVPAMVFDLQHLVSGAQGVENYTNLLRQFTATPAEGA